MPYRQPPKGNELMTTFSEAATGALQGTAIALIVMGGACAAFCTRSYQVWFGYALIAASGWVAWKAYVSSKTFAHLEIKDDRVIIRSLRRNREVFRTEVALDDLIDVVIRAKDTKIEGAQAHRLVLRTRKNDITLGGGLDAHDYLTQKAAVLAEFLSLPVGE